MTSHNSPALELARKMQLGFHKIVVIETFFLSLTGRKVGEPVTGLFSRTADAPTTLQTACMIVETDKAAVGKIQG